MIAATYVINLPASEDRWHHMQRVLRQMNAPSPQRFVATDGDMLDSAAMTMLKDQGYLHTELDGFDADSLKGEIACALSHRGVLADIVSRKLPSALILEDDIALRGPVWLWARRFARAFADVPDQWDIWYLYRCFDIAHRVKRLSRRTVIPWSPQGGAAYAVTLAGAEKLLHALTPVKSPVDRVYADVVLKGEVTAYAASPLLVLPGNHRSIINRENATREWVDGGVNRPPEYWPKKYFGYLGETAPRGLFYWKQDIVNFGEGVIYRLRKMANRT